MFPSHYTSLLMALSAVARAVVTVTAPSTVPTGASHIIDHSYVSWAVEAASFPNYTNEFSQNIFADFSARTGAPIILRVGGTSMDHSIFDLNLNETSHVANNTDGLRSDMTLGAPWFDGFARLNNTKFILHVPLARKNTTNAVAFTRKCIDSMGVENLLAIQIGNEPNLYPTQGVENSMYAVKQYVEQVKEYMELLTKNVSSLPKGRVFNIFEKSSTLNATWSIESLMGNISAVGVNLGRIQSVGQHYYQANAYDDLQATLLNHDHTVSKTNEYFQDTIQTLKKNNNITFILSEVGSSIGSRDDTRPPDLHLSGSLGSSIWTVDWMLYTMTINVTRLHMQQGRNFPFAAWRPKEDLNGDPPHTQGGFYGHVFVADFIGTQANLRVSELETHDKNITAYAGYYHGKLAKVALTNQLLFEKSQNITRPSRQVTLDLGLANEVSKVTVQKLTAPYGDSQKNITWAGLDWTDATNGKPELVMNNTETVAVSNGMVELIIGATEALLVSW